MNVRSFRIKLLQKFRYPASNCFGIERSVTTALIDVILYGVDEANGSNCSENIKCHKFNLRSGHPRSYSVIFTFQHKATQATDIKISRPDDQ